MPPVNLLIKPSSGMCNMSCEYCFYHDITQKRIQESYGFMSLDTLELLIKKTLEHAEDACTIAFQGGEPTLIGLPFFEHAVRLVKKYNTKHIPVHFALQTNGYNLDRSWGEFFAANQFLVGLSLDGTIHTHDCYRKTPSGEGTFARIMETAAMFDACHVDYNILTVVNRRTALSIRKIYRFFRKHRFDYLQFIPCLDPLGETAGSDDYSLSPEAYGRFLCELFDLWYDDIKQQQGISIRTFDNYLSIMMGMPPESCDMHGICSVQHVVEADGSIYPCDFFVFESYKLGNIKDHSFEQMHQKREEINFIEESVITNDTCKNCRWFYLCRGGCKRHRIMNMDREYERNYFCSSFRTFFAHAEPRLQELAHMLRQNRH